MYNQGFLGTKAPMFMDITLIIVSLLPFLLAIAIYVAQKKRYKLHMRLQSIIFVVSLIVIGYFEYGARTSGGFKAFLENSTLSHNYILYVLTFHIIVATMGFIIWSLTIYNAYKYNKNNTLPGNSSQKHKTEGKRAFIWMSLTSLTGIWVYLLLFVNWR